MPILKAKTKDGHWFKLVVGGTGPRGPKGEKGDKGADGTPGGPPGPAGKDGTSADIIGAVATVEPGYSAKPSVSVDVGGTPLERTFSFLFKGIQGKNGTDGKDGEPGAAGPVGPVGPVGPAGPTGDTGPTGKTGPQGPRGPAGPSYTLPKASTSALGGVKVTTWAPNYSVPAAVRADGTLVVPAYPDAEALTELWLNPHPESIQEAQEIDILFHGFKRYLFMLSDFNRNVTGCIVALGKNMASTQSTLFRIAAPSGTPAVYTREFHFDIYQNRLTLYNGYKHTFDNKHVVDNWNCNVVGVYGIN